MVRYKLLKECQEGEWVYYEVGKLCQVQKNINSFGGKEYPELVDGYIRSYVGEDTKVYPLTIHTKVVAEAIHYYYNKMHEKGLINGSKWVNWLSEKFDALMELDDEASHEKYKEIYDSIEAQIKELEYHKSFL